MESEISHQMTHRDLQSRAGLAKHAFPAIHISFRLDDKTGVSFPGELLIVNKLLAEMGGVVDLSTYALPAPIYKNARAACHQVGKVQRGNGSFINDCLI